MGILMMGCGGDDDSAPNPDTSGHDSAGGDSAGTPDSSGTPDSGTPADSASGSDGGGGTMGVACGAMTCDDGTPICCTTFGGMMMMQSCIATADMCGMGGITAACDGPEDCADPGQACCASFGGVGGGGGSECGDPAGGTCDQILCHTMADCPDMQMCCTFGFGPATCTMFPGGTCT